VRMNIEVRERLEDLDRIDGGAEIRTGTGPPDVLDVKVLCK
jgi:hypothetical protein